MSEHEITGETSVFDSPHKLGKNFYPCRCGEIFYDPQQAANHAGHSVTAGSKVYNPAGS